MMKTKHVQYETHGTCSRMIDVTADENNVIQQVFFLGGCNGNLQGISQLVRGQKIDDTSSHAPSNSSSKPPSKTDRPSLDCFIFNGLRSFLSFFYDFSWKFRKKCLSLPLY